MKFAVKDFCTIYGFSRQAFYKRIRPILPILNEFNPAKRKRTYMLHEVPLIMQFMPTKPKKIKLNFTTPELMYLSELIAHISKPMP